MEITLQRSTFSSSTHPTLSVVRLAKYIYQVRCSSELSSARIQIDTIRPLSAHPVSSILHNSPKPPDNVFSYYITSIVSLRWFTNQPFETFRKHPGLRWRPPSYEPEYQWSLSTFNEKLDDGSMIGAYTLTTPQPDNELVLKSVKSTDGGQTWNPLGEVVSLVVATMDMRR